MYAAFFAQLVSPLGQMFFRFISTFLAFILVAMTTKELGRTRLQSYRSYSLAFLLLFVQNLMAFVLLSWRYFADVPLPELYFPVVANLFQALSYLFLGYAFLYPLVQANKENLQRGLRIGAVLLAASFLFVEVSWAMAYEPGLLFHHFWGQLYFDLLLVSLLVMFIYFLYSFQVQIQAWSMGGFLLLLFAHLSGIVNLQLALKDNPVLLIAENSLLLSAFFCFIINIYQSILSENVRLYQRVQAYNMDLQGQVKQAVSELSLSNGRLEEGQRKLLLIYELSQFISSDNQLDDTIEFFMDIATEGFGISGLAVLHLNEQTESIVIRQSRGLPEGYELSLSYSDQLVADLMNEDQLFLERDQLSGAFASLAKLHSDVVDFLHITALRYGDKLAGMVAIFKTGGEVLDEGDRELFAVLSSQLVPAIYTSRLLLRMEALRQNPFAEAMATLLHSLRELLQSYRRVEVLRVQFLPESGARGDLSGSLSQAVAQIQKLIEEDEVMLLKGAAELIFVKPGLDKLAVIPHFQAKVATLDGLAFNLRYEQLSVDLAGLDDGRLLHDLFI